MEYSRKIKLGLIPLLGGLTCLAYYAPKAYNFLSKPEELVEPKREDFDKNWAKSCAAVRIPLIATVDDIGGDFYIRDLDNDNTADSMSFAGCPRWIADGYQNQVSINPDTRVMTPEIRDAATEALHADRELGFLVAQEEYRLAKEEREKKNK